MVTLGDDDTMVTFEDWRVACMSDDYALAPEPVQRHLWHLEESVVAAGCEWCPTIGYSISDVAK